MSDPADIYRNFNIKEGERCLSGHPGHVDFQPICIREAGHTGHHMSCDWIHVYPPFIWRDELT